MNLKDRMRSGSENQENPKTETSQKNPDQNTSIGTTQKSNQPSLESLVEAQSEVIQKQKDVIQAKDEEIASLKNQLQIVSSEKSKLISTLAESSEELSSTQNQNLELARENDDLRNREGLMSRKEQQKLAADLADAQNRLSDALKKVDMSRWNTDPAYDSWNLTWNTD